MILAYKATSELVNPRLRAKMAKKYGADRENEQTPARSDGIKARNISLLKLA